MIVKKDILGTKSGTTRVTSLHFLNKQEIFLWVRNSQWERLAGKKK